MTDTLVRDELAPHREGKRCEATPDPEPGCEPSPGYGTPARSAHASGWALFARIQDIPTPAAEGYLVKHEEMDRTKARLLITEAKRFLALSAASGADIAPSRQVDRAWHALLLQTVEYFGLCGALGTYVHHTTLEDPRTAPLERARRLYVDVFGPTGAECTWDGGDTDCDSSSCSTDINDSLGWRAMMPFGLPSELRPPAPDLAPGIPQI
jgi:hypothetical protein